MAHFNGPHYDPEYDDSRLGRQMDRVRAVMLDGAWRTLAEIEALTRDPPASISAQLRHLRKARFGSFIVETRARGERLHGLFEYRLLPPTTASAPPRTRRCHDCIRLTQEIEILQQEVDANEHLRVLHAASTQPTLVHDWEEIGDDSFEKIDWCWRCGCVRMRNATVTTYNVVGQIVGEDPRGATTDEPTCTKAGL